MGGCINNVCSLITLTLTANQCKFPYKSCSFLKALLSADIINVNQERIMSRWPNLNCDMPPTIKPCRLQTRSCRKFWRLKSGVAFGHLSIVTVIVDWDLNFSHLIFQSTFLFLRGWIEELGSEYDTLIPVETVEGEVVVDFVQVAVVKQVGPENPASIRYWFSRWGNYSNGIVLLLWVYLQWRCSCFSSG